MNLRILPSAVQDLHRGREFYARQSDSLGDYFLDSLFSDIVSLETYAGVHAKFLGYSRLLAQRFPFAIYYKMEGKRALFGASWIVDRIQQISRAR